MNRSVNFLMEKPIAHRGLWNEEVVENSLIAFSRAIDTEYSIELDVQMTADGKLVVFHDWTLERMTNSNGKISKKKYNEIKNLTLDNSNQKILLFEDALNLVDGQVTLIVEIKSKLYFNYKLCKKVYNLLEKYNGKYAIVSFNPFVLKWFKKNAPQIIRGQNFTDFKNKNIIVSFLKRGLSYIIWFISNNKPDFFVIRAQMLPKSLPAKIALKRKKPILTYAVKDKTEYDNIKNIVDNEFFDEKSFIN
jgi:glycerophosphoryl diester phosphodiesterase